MVFTRTEGAKPRVYHIETRKRGSEVALMLDLIEEGVFPSADDAVGYLQELANETGESFRPDVHRRGLAPITPQR